MTRLLIGNDANSLLRKRAGVGWWVQRLVWFAQAGDVLVMPVRPEDDYLRYATSLTGTPLDSLTVVVPPGVDQASPALTPASLADPRLRDAVREAIGGRTVDTVMPLWPDPSVAELAHALQIEEALPGYGFIREGGGFLVNSKSFFRAVAGGVGVPIAPGGSFSDRDGAEQAIVAALDRGESVMVKKTYWSGGAGNEVLSADPDVNPLGARGLVVVADRPQVQAYLNENWEWLTHGGAHEFVVERFYPNSTAHYAEFLITDDASVPAGEGAINSTPLGGDQMLPGMGHNEEIIPSPTLTEAQREKLVEGGHRLCEPLRLMGYRGRCSPDAIVTADGEVVFTEFNGRITASTHTYSVIGDQIVGPDYGRDRLLVSHCWSEDWYTPSFQAAVDTITEAGLAYDPATRKGVVFISALDRHNTLIHVVVAENVDEARAYEKRMDPLFTRQVAR
ncbi:peptide ligase PGM1-related protein [Micromonospora echinospora]|uniref:preATP grasp domain-containing protein n=1 Tax=Micromonospora echinospora TaxID=1877 RepID=UPI0037879415